MQCQSSFFIPACFAAIISCSLPFPSSFPCPPSRTGKARENRQKQKERIRGQERTGLRQVTATTFTLRWGVRALLSTLWRGCIKSKYCSFRLLVFFLYGEKQYRRTSASAEREKKGKKNLSFFKIRFGQEVATATN